MPRERPGYGRNPHAYAWRLAARRVPDGGIRQVGDGRHRDVAEALVRDLPGQVTWERRLETTDVVKAFDDAWLLLLASRSEGTPRVVLEALCRGRAVVGARAVAMSDVEPWAVVAGNPARFVKPRIMSEA